MTDVHSKEVRSYNMRKIKGKDTKPELLVRKYLFSKGFRYKLHDKTLSGRPDLVLPKYKTIIFVHGCFWHGHVGCKYFVIPKTKTEWWLEKINKNKFKDEINVKSLENQDWKVLVIWECELRPGNQNNTLSSLLNELEN